MYEASFELKRRPFAATPDATCFLSAGPIQAALDEIVVCVEQGQGIAVLTAPAGTGKTLLCERLRSELSDRFETIFLRHASFLTRRALLQTLLCELNQPYQHPSEQELRLALFPAIRDLQPRCEALVLICDEAHQLTESLIEELRILADFAEFGKPLVRLVLVGQLSLEEKLTQPSLEAFNQRIRAHVNLPTFDHAASLDYIDYRLTWAGGRTNETFTDAALDMIARASDGIPRCINQLADHTLLLGFVAEQRPAGEELVLEALSDLRQLPLHWNEPSSSRKGVEQVESSDFNGESSVEETTSIIRGHGGIMLPDPKQTMYSYESTIGENRLENDHDFASFDLIELEPENSVTYPTFPEAVEAVIPTDHNTVEIDSDDWRHVVNLFSRANTELEIEPDESQTPFETTAADFETVDVQQSKVDFVVKQESINNSPSEIYHDNKFETHVSTPHSVTVQSSHGFDEEVIFDRYATIDAGLIPVVPSQPDTKRVVEVHEEIAPIAKYLSIPAFEPHTMNNIVLDEFSELDTDHNPISVPRHEVADPRHDVSDPLDNVLEMVNDLTAIVSEQIESSESKPAEEIQPSVFNNPPVDNNDLILKSLRRDDAEVAINSSHNSVYRRSLAANEAAWQAIETAPVEAASAAEPRPFRFLFSMLRRKQQQTS
jgi:type II secretory pathway predicted ATPase ExeA